MNKSELIEHVARQADISKAAATRAVNAMVSGVTSSLKRKKPVTIAGLRSLVVSKPAVRAPSRPKLDAAPKRKPTSSAKRAKVAKVPKFRPGKGLRDAL